MPEKPLLFVEQPQTSQIVSEGVPCGYSLGNSFRGAYPLPGFPRQAHSARGMCSAESYRGRNGHSRAISVAWAVRNQVRCAQVHGVRFPGHRTSEFSDACERYLSPTPGGERQVQPDDDSEASENRRESNLCSKQNTPNHQGLCGKCQAKVWHR